ncbi:MAG: Ribonuclease H [candidate division TM6 bacterium GW2011_GWF2_37_49]|nr:MAG: Ribonuclease H [candidate division TM6 bacterium GW2011_GWF2_37_49]
MEKQLNIFANNKKEPVTKDTSTEIKRFFAEKKVPVVENWAVFVDGAARGNPGPAGCGIYVINDNKDIIKKGFFLGTKTNNQAEYIALLLAVFLIKKKLQELEIENIILTIHSDSELLVRQMCGFYKIKNAVLQCINSMIERMLKGIPHKFIHIMREKNKIADKLANLGVDKKVQLPKEFFDFVADFKDIVEIIRS